MNLGHICGLFLFHIHYDNFGIDSEKWYTNFIGGMYMERSIYPQIEFFSKRKAITFILGARGVGKTTLASSFIKEGFSYVSLDDSSSYMEAYRNPASFIENHKSPLIIDEVNKVPSLLSYIESSLNKRKLEGEEIKGSYILISSSTHNLNENMTEGLKEYSATLHVDPLSHNEIIGRNDDSLSFDISKWNERASKDPLPLEGLYSHIVDGFFPGSLELNHDEKRRFNSDYIEDCLGKDIPSIVSVKDRMLFRSFLEQLALSIGQELIYDKIAKTLSIDMKTAKSWVKALSNLGVIYLLEPYNEMNMSRKLTKRTKLYFVDTGLAAYLAKIDDGDSLKASPLSKYFINNYILNELRKSYHNNGMEPNFYYYRNAALDEIDLLLFDDDGLHLFLFRDKEDGYSIKDTKVFSRFDKSAYKKATSGIIGPVKEASDLGEDTLLLPIAGI